MRDFQADVLSGALAGKPIPASEFSWSAARNRLFSECRRAYFIRYYLAQGGWNVHAHRLTRTAYLEKHIPPFAVWLAQTLENSAASALTGLRFIGQNRKRDFAGSLPRALGREVSALASSLQRKAYLDDPKLPGVREHFLWREGFRTADEVVARAVPVLTRACEFLTQSDFAVSPDGTESPLRDTACPFLEIPRHTFSIWLKGGILRNCGRTVSLLRFRYRADDADAGDGDGVDSALFSAFAKSRNPFCESCLTTLVFSRSSAEFVPAPPPLPSKILWDFIDGSAAGMLAAISPDGTVRAEDFPETADWEQCASCAFAGSCAMLQKYERKPE